VSSHKKVYKENNFKKKILCINNDDDSSDDESSDSSIESKINDIMLIDLEDLNTEDTRSEFSYCEAVVDLEGELFSAMENIDRLREKKRKQKQLLLRYEKTSNEPSEEIALLKVKLEEAKKIEDILKQKLKEVKTKGEKMEAEVVAVRKDLEKFQALYH
jgi:chromosome segregation ATPase